MRKKVTWSHTKKFKGRKYTGSYRYVFGEREFVLSTTLKNGKAHNVTFESSEAAKVLGWKKN